MNTPLLNQLLSPLASAKASRKKCNNSNNHDDDDESSSHFQTTVCLYDWWLVKADKDFEGKRISVAGFTSRELQAMRVFNSAPIVKRYDIFTLESVDGICIILKGFINKLRTKENGFSAEVFSHFMFGFPPCWEEYNEKCLEEEFTTGAGLATVPDISGSASAHKCMTNANPNTTPINCEVNGKNNHNVEDINECSENVSEVTTNASKDSDWRNHAVKDNNVEKEKENASENLLPSVSCDINVVSLPKDNLALPAEFLSYNVTGSPERMANSKSCTKDNKGTVWKSKTQEPASLESLTIINAALEERPIPKAADVEILNSSNWDQAVPVGDSSLDMRIASTKSRTQEAACLGSVTIGNGVLGECPIPKASDVENLNSSTLDPAVSIGDSGLDLRITSRKSKTQEPTCLESTTSCNAALGECSMSKASDIENLNSSNLDPAAPVGNPGVDMRITSCTPKNSKQQEEIDGVTCGNKDFSTFSLPQEFVATVRCTGEKSSGVECSSLSSFGCSVMHTTSLFTSPVNEDPNSRKLSGNYVHDAMNFAAMESVVNVNGFTSTKLHTNALKVTPSNSGSRKTRNQNKHSGGSVKCKSNELMPQTSKRLDGENFKRCSSGTTIHSGKKIDVLETARSQSIKRMVRNMTGNSEGKEKERHPAVLAMKSKRNTMDSATLVSDRTSNLEGMNVFDFCDGKLQQPIHDTLVKNNSKQGKDHRKESQARTRREKPNNSDKSRNEFGDTNHQCETETAVKESVETDKGHSSKKKAQRRISFDSQASSVTLPRKENIISPESLSLKRSRSGRLLLPSLDFWRNQIPVYDAERKITGIQVATPSKGSKSEPQKKWRR